MSSTLAMNRTVRTSTSRLTRNAAAAMEALIDAIEPGINPYLFLQEQLHDQVYSSAPAVFNRQTTAWIVLFALMLAMSLVALFVRWWRGHFWLYRLVPTTRGSFLSPNSSIAFLSYNAIYLILFQPYTYYGQRFSEGQGDLRNIILWKSYIFVSLWEAAWSVAWSTAISGALYGGTPLCPAWLFNSYFIGVSLLVPILVFPVFGVSSMYWNRGFASYEVVDKALQAAAMAWPSNGVALDMMQVQQLVPFVTALDTNINRCLSWYKKGWSLWSLFGCLLVVSIVPWTVHYVSMLQQQIKTLRRPANRLNLSITTPDPSHATPPVSPVFSPQFPQTPTSSPPSPTGKEGFVSSPTSKMAATPSTKIATASPKVVAPQGSPQQQQQPKRTTVVQGMTNQTKRKALYRSFVNLLITSIAICSVVSAYTGVAIWTAIDADQMLRDPLRIQISYYLAAYPYIIFAGSAIFLLLVRSFDSQALWGPSSPPRWHWHLHHPHQHKRTMTLGQQSHFSTGSGGNDTPRWKRVACFLSGRTWCRCETGTPGVVRHPSPTREKGMRWFNSGTESPDSPRSPRFASDWPAHRGPVTRPGDTYSPNPRRVGGGLDLHGARRPLDESFVMVDFAETTDTKDMDDDGRPYARTRPPRPLRDTKRPRGWLSAPGIGGYPGRGIEGVEISRTTVQSVDLASHSQLDDPLPSPRTPVDAFGDPTQSSFSHRSFYHDNASSPRHSRSAKSTKSALKVPANRHSPTSYRSFTSQMPQTGSIAFPEDGGVNTFGEIELNDTVPPLATRFGPAPGYKKQQSIDSDKTLLGDATPPRKLSKPDDSLPTKPSKED